MVTVSSALYTRARLDLTDLSDSQHYSPGRAYLRSKLANVLFAVELQQRLHDAGSPVRSFAAHPWMARTPLHATYPSAVTRTVTRRSRTPSAGSRSRPPWASSRPPCHRTCRPTGSGAPPGPARTRRSRRPLRSRRERPQQSHRPLGDVGTPHRRACAHPFADRHRQVRRGRVPFAPGPRPRAGQLFEQTVRAVARHRCVASVLVPIRRVSLETLSAARTP